MIVSFALPKRFKKSKRGACVPAVITLLPGLPDDANVIEGWVISGKNRHDHTWLEISGMFYDPTIEQFRRLKCFSVNPMQYVVNKVIPVSVYRIFIRAGQSEFWKNRVHSFGGVL